MHNFNFLSPAAIVRPFIGMRDGKPIPGVAFYALSRAPIHCHCTHCQAIGGIQYQLPLG